MKYHEALVIKTVDLSEGFYIEITDYEHGIVYGQGLNKDLKSAIIMAVNDLLKEEANV